MVLNTKKYSNGNNICQLLIDSEIATIITQLYRLYTNKIIITFF